MAHRLLWVHGIGRHRPGYSAPWESAFNQYLHLPHEEYVEICWDTVFDPAIRGLRADGARIELTRQEKLAEAEVRADLETILLARSAALAQEPPVMGARGADDAAGVITWAQYRRRRTVRGALLPDWLKRPDTYLGDFVKYLVSRSLRNAVKERAKECLRPLAGGAHGVAIVAHSWGTVVAYDSLLDLEVELPALRVANLLTLGSPLWLVRHLLEDRSGRKPGGVAKWTNIHARGDAVGSWLSAGFKVDKEFEVPNFGGGDAHGSYFLPGNEAVQHDIIAGAVLA